MTQLELPEAKAGPQPTLGSGSGDVGASPAQDRMSQERQDGRDAASAEPHAPTSNKPLSWRIPYARHMNSSGADSVDCVTAVSVVNFGPNNTNVDVEFLNSAGGSEGIANRLELAPWDPDVFVTDDDVLAVPFIYDKVANMGPFDGYALVLSDDPRILVTAVLRCGEDGVLLPTVLSAIPAYPADSTAEYFQAAVPAPVIPHFGGNVAAESRN
jgi:hypothetical protein